jgi:hypothetical protein
VFFIPTFTAFTSSRLSLFVRPLTVGTVIGGSSAVESFPVRDAVLEDVFPEAPLVGMLFVLAATAADPAGT